jgi:GNAT superfamily N-acetyltransferase
MQTESRLTSTEELSLAQWRNSCELWKRQCAEPESTGVFQLREVDPYLLVLRADSSPIPHLGRVEHDAKPDIEAFGSMFKVLKRAPNEAPFSLRLHPQNDVPSWRDFLTNLGFQPSTTKQLAMGCSLAETHPLVEADVDIDKVEPSDESKLAMAERCNGEAFAAPPKHQRFFLNPRTVDVYLARFQGVAAGSATAAYVEDTVGIYGVATRPAFRGRGVAGAMVSRILQDARSRSKLAVLDCQPELAPLYGRSGFRVAREMPTFLLLASRI